MDRIGLIAAMPSESQALLRKVKSHRRISLDPFRGAVFQAGNQECFLATSGMGVRHAEAAARLLIETVHPRCLISFGIAGAVREDLQIGDVVMASQNATLGNGVLQNCQPLAELSGEIWKAVRQTLSADHIGAYSGTAITTNGSQVLLQNEGLPFPILEMETSGLLQAAQAHRIPLIVIRAVSDGPQAPLPLDLAAVMDENSRLLPGKLLLELFKHPGILFKAGPMLKNSRIAAENAANAVLIALNRGTYIREMECML